MPCDRPSSKKQLRWAFAAEERGELPKGKAREWARKYKRKKGSKVAATDITERDFVRALAGGPQYVRVPTPQLVVQPGAGPEGFPTVKQVTTYQKFPVKKQVVDQFLYGIPLFTTGLGGAVGGITGALTAPGKTFSDVGWGALKGGGIGALAGAAAGLAIAIGQYLYDKIKKTKTVVYYTETGVPMLYAVGVPAESTS